MHVVVDRAVRQDVHVNVQSRPITAVHRVVAVKIQMNTATALTFDTEGC